MATVHYHCLSPRQPHERCIIPTYRSRIFWPKAPGLGCGGTGVRKHIRKPRSPPLKHTSAQKQHLRAGDGAEGWGLQRGLHRCKEQGLPVPPERHRQPPRPAAFRPPGGLGRRSPWRAPGGPQPSRASSAPQEARRSPRSRQPRRQRHTEATRPLGPRGGTSAGRRDPAAPQPRRIRVPRLRTHLPRAPPPPPPAPGTRSTAQATVTASS